MNAKLVIISGPEAGREIPLPEGSKLALGRGQASDMRLNDPRISRVHCTVEAGHEGVILRDSGSTGGTFVGGRKISKHRLCGGDEVQIGDSRLKFQSDDEQRSRFVRAVHTMINVRHPNLVEIYGAGKQGPFCWCAMECVDGISIMEMIQLIGIQGQLDWREVDRVAVHVARALEYAHQQKVIHRNVTPDNLLQRKHDRVVKLCDLMLAKALEGTQSKQVTAPGQLVGNVA